MRASAQVTSPGAVISMIVAVSWAMAQPTLSPIYRPEIEERCELVHTSHWLSHKNATSRYQRLCLQPHPPMIMRTSKAALKKPDEIRALPTTSAYLPWSLPETRRGEVTKRNHGTHGRARGRIFTATSAKFSKLSSLWPFRKA
jgi:uncharacterized protein (DUF1810 family)